MILQPRLSQAAARATRCSARSTTLLSSMARVIGPIPPGIGATQPATSRTLGSRSPTQPGVGTGDADVDADRARFDHVSGDESWPPRCRNDDVSLSSVPGQSRRSRCGTG